MDLKVSRMCRETVGLLAVALVLAACSARAEVASGPVGCWQSNRPALGAFVLDYDEVTGEPRYSPDDWGDFPIRNEWHPLSTEDSIRINYGYGGFSGETVMARVLGDSLIGVSLPFTDAVTESSLNSVDFVALRVACSGLEAGSI